LRIGGKLGPASGDPVDVRATVRGLAEGAHQRFGKAAPPMGNMAWLRIGDDDAEAIDVVVNDHRTQGFSPECFTAAGLDIARLRGLIVKSTQHFHAGFLPVADDILYVAAPGCGSMDMRSLPLARVTRALWPRVADPHAA
jgi:microcystin degradation protein MlrC